MKITFCTYDSPTFTGGPNTWFRRFLPALAERGVEIELLAFVEGDSDASFPLLDALPKSDVQIFRAAWNITTEEKIDWILSRLIAAPPDIFFPNMLVSGFFAGAWAKRSGIPTIGMLHSDDNFHRALLDEFVFGKEEYRLSALVCVSKFLHDFTVRRGNTSTELFRIPYGIPTYSSPTLPEEGVFRIAWLGRLAQEQKRVFDVANALIKLSQLYPSTEAVMYGAGHERDNLVQLLAGAKAKVRYGGFVPNEAIQQVLANHHAVCLLSDYEGIPLAILEAMGAGVVPICLATRSGIPEIIEHKLTGLIVHDRDVDFIQAVAWLMEHSEERRNMGKRARELIAQNFDPDRMLDRWMELFTRVTEKKTTVPITLAPRFRLPRVNPGLSREDCRRRPIWRRIASRLKSIVFDPLGTTT